MGKFFTTTEAAQFLGVSVRTIKRWKKSGKLVPVSPPTGDNFTNQGDNFALEDLARVTTSKFKHFKKRRRFKKLEGIMKKKYQVQERLKKAVVPCDKLSNHMFNYSEEEFAEIILDGEECGCVEGYDRKGNKIVTPYWLKPSKEYENIKPLTAFDREVLNVAISAYEAGYRVLSFKMTLNAMTGDDKSRIWSEQYEALKAAFKRLMTGIKIDLAPLLKAFPKYRKRHVGTAELTSPILPCKLFEVEINGQRTLAVELLSESPLMTVAKLKRQLITYDLEPLAVPNQNNTPQVMTIKGYLLRRIELMKQRHLTPTILFETLYQNCGLADADKWQKQDARKDVTETLNHFKSVGVIKDFHFERQGNTYRAIIIDNDPPQIHSRKCE